MPRGNCNPKNVKNDPGSGVTNLTTCNSTSQDELSIYEIDILSYGNPKGSNDDVFTYKNGKKWKFKFNESELMVENEALQGKDEVTDDVEIPFNPLIKSHYPILEALRAEPDLNSVSLEIESEKTSAENGTNHKFSFKEKPDDKKYSSSLDSKGSKEKFKSNFGKLLMESFVEESDGKIKKLKKNLKKLDNESVHFHHHEHHHHYYLSSSKAQNIKNYLKMIRSPYPKKKNDDSEEKKQEEPEKRDTSAVNISSTATYICNPSQSLSQPKTDDSNSQNSNIFPTGKRNSHIYMPNYSNSIDSFLGTTSDLVMAHTFSQTDLSKGGSNKSSGLGEVHRKKTVEPNTKDIQSKLSPKKLSKPEYNQLMEVLETYVEPKATAKANAKVTYIPCECNTENEDGVNGMGNRGSAVLLETSTMETNFTDESGNQRTVRTKSGKNRYASYFSAKRSNEPVGLKTISHLDLTKYLKQELKEIKDRLRDLETLYSKRRMNTKCLAIDLRGSNLEQKIAPGQEIHVFSTKTYIMKADNECSKESSPCSTLPIQPVCKRQQCAYEGVR